MRILICTILIFLCSGVQAQLRRPGKIVDKNGQTREGWINDLETANFKSIEFNGDTYTPEQIKGFSSTRPVTFESHEVEYDTDRQDLNRPPRGIIPRNTKAWLFLEVIVDAKIGLLKYVDDNDRIHFFIKTDTAITELLNRLFYDSVSTRSNFNERFKRQILRAGLDCPQIKKSYRILKYNQPALKKAIIALNECHGYQFTVPAKNQNTTAAKGKKPSIGLVLEPFANSFEFGAGSSTFTKTGMKEVNVAAGVFGELFVPSKPNRFSFYNEVTFKSVKNTSNTPNGSGSGVIVRNFDFNRLKVSNLFRISIPSEKGGRFFFDAGVNWGYRFNTKMKGYELYTATFTDEKYHYLKGFEWGVSAGIGKTWNINENFRFTTEFRYTIEVNTGNLSNVKTESAGLCIQVPIF